MSWHAKVVSSLVQGMKATTRLLCPGGFETAAAASPACRTHMSHTSLLGRLLQISQSNFLFRRKWMDIVCRFWHISNVNEWSTLEKDEKVMPVLQKDIASFFGRLGHCNTSATPGHSLPTSTTDTPSNPQRLTCHDKRPGNTMQYIISESIRKYQKVIDIEKSWQDDARKDSVEYWICF